MLLNTWIRSGKDTKFQPIKRQFPLGMKLGTKITEVKFLMHIIILNDVRCFDGKKLKGWVDSHFSDQIRQDIHSLTDNSQNLWRAMLYQLKW